MLSYEMKKCGLLVRLTGELDHSAACELREELDGLIARTGAKRLLPSIACTPLYFSFDFTRAAF